MGKVRKLKKQVKSSAAAGQESPFVKMKLVPIDEKEQKTCKVIRSKPAHIENLEKQVRHADPIVAAMARSVPYIAGFPPKQRKKLGSTMSVAIQNSHLDRYNKLEQLRESAQYMSPPIMAAPQPQTQPQPPPPPTPLQLPIKTETKYEQKIFDDIGEAESKIPTKQRKKFNQLVAFLDGRSGTVGRTKTGELVLNGDVLRGTNYVQAIRSLYVNTKAPSPGMRDLVSHLKNIGAPVSMFTSTNAKHVYGQLGGGKRKKVKKIRNAKKLASILHVY